MEVESTANLENIFRPFGLNSNKRVVLMCNNLIYNKKNISTTYIQCYTNFHAKI